MIYYLLALGPIVGLLFLSEILWRKKILRGELARKFVHILAGIHVAFWAYYLSYDAIFIIAIATFVLLTYSRQVKLFHAIHDVHRITIGELIYPLGVAVTALLGMEQWIFAISILFMALADGMAAVMGKIFGKNNQYKVFGSKMLKKSVIGTLSYLTFAVYAMALGLFIGGSDTLNANLALTFIALPLASAVMENISPYGLDNFTTPLLVTLVLNSLL
jgi:dolichol kinase